MNSIIKKQAQAQTAVVSAIVKKYHLPADEVFQLAADVYVKAMQDSEEETVKTETPQERMEKGREYLCCINCGGDLPAGDHVKYCEDCKAGK